MATSFEIGGHSANHTALARFPPAVQEREIEENKKFLAAINGSAPTGFSYAHDSYNDHSIDILKKHDFRYACTTGEGRVTANTDVFALPRCHVKDWTGAVFNGQLAKWFTNPQR